MKLPYGKSNFEELRKDGFYYVDKTKYIEYLENADSEFVFFLRPRRFGKSLFVSMLEYYYAVQYKNEFNSLFGDLYIGKKPTQKANSYLVLKFDFSGIDTHSLESSQKSFNNNVFLGVKRFIYSYADYFEKQGVDTNIEKDNAEIVLGELFSKYTASNISVPIFIIIDEYDHFANELLAFRFDDFIGSVSKNGFVRKFYEKIKIATSEKIVARFFVTGVTPITLDSLTNGFNISKNFTLRRALNEVMGFTREEVKQLLLDTANTRDFSGFDIEKTMGDLEKWYNGYLFNKDATQRVYNSDMILNFTTEFAENRFTKYPDEIIDINIASDYSKIQSLFKIREKKRNYDIIDNIIQNGKINCNLTVQYNFEREFSDDDFVSLLFYMGYLSILEHEISELVMKIPNFVIATLFYKFFEERIRKISEIDVDSLDIRKIVKKLAQNNEIHQFVALIESSLQALSNRDFIQFDEKYIKLLFVAFANAAGFYYVKSEPEVNQLYPDVMFLWRPPYFSKYQFIFELKYLKKKDANLIDKKTNEAVEQMKKYLSSNELQDYIERKEGGIETVKAYVVIFAGNKAEIIKEI